MAEGKEDQREEALKADPEHPFVSSRLCIKNLPKHYTERRFREHFSAIGEVTDCVIKNTHGGTDENDSRSSWRQHRKQQQQTSRCLGFIGYKTEQMATLSAEIFPQHVHRYESDRCLVRGESERASEIERKEFVVEVFGGDEREREIEKRGREEVKKEE